MLNAAEKDGLLIEVSFDDGGYPLYKGTVASEAWKACDAFEPHDQIFIILYEKSGRECGRAVLAPYLLPVDDLAHPSGGWVEHWWSKNDK